MLATVERVEPESSFLQAVVDGLGSDTYGGGSGIEVTVESAMLHTGHSIVKAKFVCVCLRIVLFSVEFCICAY